MNNQIIHHHKGRPSLWALSNILLLPLFVNKSKIISGNLKCVRKGMRTNPKLFEKLSSIRTYPKNVLLLEQICFIFLPVAIESFHFIGLLSSYFFKSFLSQTKEKKKRVKNVERNFQTEMGISLTRPQRRSGGNNKN